MKERGENNFYLCEISREMVIDATHKANKSRYINHSCQPNTELQKWLDIWIIAVLFHMQSATKDHRFTWHSLVHAIYLS